MMRMSTGESLELNRGRRMPGIEQEIVIKKTRFRFLSPQTPKHKNIGLRNPPNSSKPV